jgi:hypothetical protein
VKNGRPGNLCNPAGAVAADGEEATVMQQPVAVDTHQQPAPTLGNSASEAALRRLAIPSGPSNRIASSVADAD